MVSKKLPASLVVGGPGSGKRALVSRIIGQPLTSADSCCGWTIDTPYYTADTKVVIRRPDGSKFGDLSGYEALVLVFDASDEGSWEAVRCWAEAQQEHVETTDITLVVANKVDKLDAEAAAALDSGYSPASGEQPQHWLAGVEGWCVERGFELVRACGADAALDADLQFDGERQGVVRVTDALHAHMWPGLVRKERRVPAGSARGGGTGSTAAAERPQAGADPVDASAGAAHSAAACSAAAPAGLGVGSEPPADVLLGGTPAGEEEEEEEAAHEAEIRAVEALFGELTGARTRLAGMPDDERRSAAAAMAMRLAAALGLDEDEDEEGEGAGQGGADSEGDATA